MVPKGKIIADKVYSLYLKGATRGERLAALDRLQALCKRHGIPFNHYYKIQKDTRQVFIDFETYSESPLPDVGAWVYAHHPSTELICLAWSYNGESPYIWREAIDGMDHPDLEELFNRIKDGWEVHAWNAQFEYYIWNYCAVPNYGWPEVPLEQFYDSQALALSLALPLKLGECGAALGLEQQKDKSGTRLINKLSKPRKPTKYNPSKRWFFREAEDDYREMYKYCMQDVVAEHAIHAALPIDELQGYERDLWLMTVRMNDNGVPIDIDTVENLRFILQEYEKVQIEKLSKITNGEVTTPGQIARMKKWIKETSGIEFDSLNAETVQNALEDDKIPENVKELLRIRRFMSRTSTKKYNRIVDMVDEHGFVHDILRYHMATTGRWGGAGLQVHNLPNAKIDDPDLVSRIARWRSLALFMLFYSDPMYVGSAMIRPIVRAKRGYKLYVSDFSSIENRVTCWLAGDKVSLQMFKDNIDQYKWFATKLYEGVKYEDVSKHQRTHAKTCILGLGYGMGVDKFFETCVNYGFDITYNEAKRSVDLYREVFNLIVDLWYESYARAMAVVLDGRTRRYNYLEFERDKQFLYMKLPSGRRIAYYDPRIELVDTPWGEKKRGITFMGHQPYTRKWARLKLIPGRLIENAAQGMARDILAESKLRLIDAGYNVIFSVHDENVSHDPVDFGSLKEFNQIMCDTNTKTYPGLPIASEGFATNRYRK